MMNYILRIALLVLVLVSSLFSQVINGFVRDDATGEPLSYANVFIKDSNLGVASGVDGYYALTNIPAGEYAVIASIIGYAMITKDFTIKEDENLRIDFRMISEAIEGERVDVFGEAQKMRQLVEPSRISLDLRTIETAPAFIEPDLFRTIQMLPGVQTINDYSSALYVRGSTPDQNLIMMDGITIYNPYHLGGIFSTFNTSSIKEADFHAGGFTARYGGRMGAILNVVTREGNTEKFEGSYNVSSMSSKVLLEGPLPKLYGMKGSWMLAGRRTYLDQFLNLLIRGDDLPFRYYFYDYQGKVNLDINQDHRLTYSRFYGDDIVEFSFSDTYSDYNVVEDYEQNEENTTHLNWPWGNKTNSLTWRWLISPKLVARTFIANSRYRFDFNFGFQQKGDWRDGSESSTYNEKFEFDFYDIIDDNTVETELSWHGIKNHQIMGGFQIKKVDYDLGMDFEFETLDTLISLSPLSQKDQTVESSLFFQDKWNLTQKIVLQLGGRFMDYSEHDELYFDPRLGFKYLVKEDLSFKLSLGRYHQFLTIANPEDETWRIIDFWLGITEEQKAPYSDHYILGLEYLSEDNWLFRCETYYKHFENLITLKQGQLFTEDESGARFTPFNEFYPTKAYAYGLELLYKKTAGRLRGWIGYTYAETKKHIDKHGWYNPKYDRRHTVNIVGDFRIIENLHFSTSLQTSSGQPYTPQIGRYQEWQVNNDPYLPFYGFTEAYLVGKKNSERLKPYFRIDMGFKHKTVGKILKIPYERFFQIVNVTNYVNALNYQYRAKVNRRTEETLGVERAAIPMFPTLIAFGYRWSF